MSVLNNVKNNGANKIKSFQNAVKEVNAREKEVSVLNVFDAHNVVRSFGVMNGSGNQGVGPTTNDNTNQLGLSLCPKFAKEALIKHFKLTESQVKANVGVKYVGLPKKLAIEMFNQEQFNSDNREVWITMVNNDMVDGLIKDMESCDLFDDANIEKIFWDLTVIYRMYQERIIDSAKKAYKVVIHIAIKCYRALSLQKIKFAVRYSEDKITIREDQKEIDPMAGSLDGDFFIYKPTPVVQLEDGSNRMFFRDPISMIQVELAKYLEDLISAANELEIEMSEKEVNRLMAYKGDGPVEDLVSVIKYAYYVLSKDYREKISTIDKDENEELYRRYKEEYNKATDTLQIPTRQLLADYSPERAATIMQFIACNGQNGFDPKSSNQMGINLLTPEYMTMIVNTVAEVKVMGYPILINISNLKDGDVMEFINGVSDNGDVLDFGKEIEYATGEFKITKFNGKLYGVQDIKFDIPKADFTKRVFFVRPTNDMNLDEVIDALKEDSYVSVRRDGVIYKQCEEIAEVKFSGNGVGLEKLLGVAGTITYLKVVELEGNRPQIMFELSDINILESVDEEDDIVDDFTTNIVIENDTDDGIKIESADEDIDFEDFDENGIDDIEIEL